MEPKNIVVHRWMIQLTATKLRKCNDDSIHENYTSPSSLFPKLNIINTIKYHKHLVYVHAHKTGFGVQLNDKSWIKSRNKSWIKLWMKSWIKYLIKSWNKSCIKS